MKTIWIVMCPSIWSLLWYGRMVSNKDIWEHFRTQNKNVLVIEVGGIKETSMESWTKWWSNPKQILEQQIIMIPRAKQFNINLKLETKR